MYAYYILLGGRRGELRRGAAGTGGGMIDSNGNNHDYSKSNSNSESHDR